MQACFVVCFASFPQSFIPVIHLLTDLRWKSGAETIFYSFFNERCVPVEYCGKLILDKTPSSINTSVCVQRFPVNFFQFFTHFNMIIFCLVSTSICFRVKFNTIYFTDIGYHIMFCNRCRNYVMSRYFGSIVIVKIVL